MADWNELTPAELGEQIATASHLLGIAVGYGEVARVILTMSGEAFAQRDDERAHTLRGLSKLIDDLSREKRKQYDERKRIQEAAFAQLDQLGEVCWVCGSTKGRHTPECDSHLYKEE